MAKAKELGNLLANRLRMAGNPDTGNSQIGTANPPDVVAPTTPSDNMIQLPVSEVGNVQEGDIVTLRVVSTDGTNASCVLNGIKKLKTSAPTNAPTNAPAPPVTNTQPY